MTEMQHAQQDKEIRNLPEEAGNRDRIIVRTSLLGIGANVLLAAVKAVVGFFTGSIAISLDAVNNLSDAGSGIITIAGTRLAAKRPDRQHPYGHGRLEYLSAMALGAIIMSAGLSYIGLGIQPPTPEWGAMLADGRQHILLYPHMIMFPGLIIALTVLSINLLGDGIRDAIDPKLRS